MVWKLTKLYPNRISKYIEHEDSRSREDYSRTKSEFQYLKINQCYFTTMTGQNRSHRVTSIDVEGFEIFSV